MMKLLLVNMFMDLQRVRVPHNVNALHDLLATRRICERLRFVFGATILHKEEAPQNVGTSVQFPSAREQAHYGLVHERTRDESGTKSEISVLKQKTAPAHNGQMRKILYFLLLRPTRPPNLSQVDLVRVKPAT